MNNNDYSFYSFFCPQAGRPRRRNATAPGTISLRSIHACGVTAPAKVAYAATGIFFCSFPPHENCVRKSRNERLKLRSV